MTVRVFVSFSRCNTFEVHRGQAALFAEMCYLKYMDMNYFTVYPKTGA